MNLSRFYHRPMTGFKIHKAEWVRILLLAISLALFPHSIWAAETRGEKYAENTTSDLLTREEKHFITTHTPLIFSEVNWKPLSIADNPDGFDGMIADYFNMITRRSGLMFEFQKSTTWAEVLQKYADRAIEVIPALGKDDDVGREILLSDPFVQFPMVIVTRNDVSYITDTAQLNNRKVAVGKGYTSYHFLKKNYPAIDLVQTEDVTKGLILLANHDVSAFVGHLAVVINTIQNLGLTNLKIAGETEFMFDHRIGLDPRYPQAVSIINKVLDGMTEKEHRAIYQKWVNVEYDTGIDYSFFGKIMGCAALFVILVIYWNRKLAWEVKERKQTEQHLMESEKRIKAILDAISTGFILINPENRIIEDVNPAAARMIGLPRDHIIGHVCHEFICPMKESDCPIIDHGRQIDNSEQILLAAEGRGIPILKTVMPVTLNGKQQLLESFVDLTDRKEAEKELQQNYQELERFYQLTVGREEKMINLKKEINLLLLQSGKKEKYKIR